jgi:broad specificity phosphatase PhoE
MLILTKSKFRWLCPYLILWKGQYHCGKTKLVYEFIEGWNVLVVAHANTLRGLVKTIDNIGNPEIQEVAVPLGIPNVYKFDIDENGKLKSSPPTKEEISVSQIHMNGKFLEKPGQLKEVLKREEEWSKFCTRTRQMG